MKRIVASSLLTTSTIVLLLFGCRPVSSDEHVVYWNSTNKMFRNRHPTIEVRMGDVVRFVCPDNEGRAEGEYLTVYEVTEFAMGECSQESSSREIIRCGPEGTAEKMLRTHQLDGRGGEQRQRNQKVPPKNIAQLIRQLNPIPDGKEYKVGQTYYYMTTSTGKASGLNHQMFGLCQSHNMRLSMKVVASQPLAHPVKPMAPTRRQEDFVTKSSAERRQEEEDEDSENDSAHLLPRDIAMNPKFRRPSQLEQAAASAGVQVDQLDKVVQMAKEGKTGTFENEKREEARKEKEGWDPVNVQYMADLMNNAYQNAEERITYQREPDFEIHEENDLSVKSLEYSSSVSPVSSLFVFGFLSSFVFFFFC